MNFTDRFNILAGEMSDYLKVSTVEVLVRYGFRVGTAGKVITYGREDLENTTINTLKNLVSVIGEVEGGDLEERFNDFLSDAFELIEEAPRKKLIDDSGLSSSTLSSIRSKGSDGNYQTSKFLILADAALNSKD